MDKAIAASKNHWERAQAAATKYYNKKRKDITYGPGDMVLLSSKHVRLQKASRKLADKFLGPFEVLRVVNRNAYTLNLPPKYGRLSRHLPRLALGAL